MERAAALYGKALRALAIIACGLLVSMMILICADVLLRNIAAIPSLRGLPWVNDVAETMLYTITMFTAPWLLHHGQHIRVDVVLRALPARAGWYCEYLNDVLTVLACLTVVVYGAVAAHQSYADGSMTVKSIVVAEWLVLIPLPISFLLLSAEMIFRLRRLYSGPRKARDDSGIAA
jgi:TRAP-type C4-dicarboxylate transport system permease small subunit